jgi:hypothetical protein
MQLKDTTATATKPKQTIRKTLAAQGHNSHIQQIKQNHKKNTCSSRTPQPPNQRKPQEKHMQLKDTKTKPDG